MRVGRPSSAMESHPFSAETKWTLLERARQAGLGVEFFCENYRKPILGWLQVRFPHHDAEDLCHDFFRRHVIGGCLVDRADRAKGSLRGLLCVALTRFSRNERRRQRTVRAGGQVQHVPFHENDGTGDRPDAGSPDVLFDWFWAVELLERAIRRTEDYCHRRGKGPVFDALRPLLDGSGPGRRHKEIATELGMKVAEVTNELYRLRMRVKSSLFDEILMTVRDARAAAEEWEALRSFLMR